MSIPIFLVPISGQILFFFHVLVGFQPSVHFFPANPNFSQIFIFSSLSTEHSILYHYIIAVNNIQTLLFVQYLNKSGGLGWL